MPRTVLFVLLAFFSTGVSADTVWKGTSTFSNATGSGDVLDPVGATVYLSGDSTGSERFIGTTTSLDAAPLRRREVRLSGLLRVKEGAGNAALWVRADGPDGPLAFVNSAGAPVRVGTGVHSRELRLYIPSGTTSLKLGVTLESAGRVEVEDLRLTSESTTSGGASAYDMLEYALATIPGNALNAGNVDWPKERATRLTPDLKELPAAEGYKQIRAILDALADRHSFLQQPREASEYLSSAVPTKAIEARQLPDIGYVLVPGLRGTNAAAGEAFAMQLCEQVKRLAPSSSKGWILDLRQNTGGNMWPMMSGLYPLLGSSGIGAFRDRDGARRPWRLRARKGCDFNLTNSRVAVLVGPRTGSSGEAVAIAFRARAETKFFGRTTAGRATSNRSYPLPDGGALRLTTSTLLDRSGEEYPQGITPWFCSQTVRMPSKRPQSGSVPSLRNFCTGPAQVAFHPPRARALAGRKGRRMANHTYRLLPGAALGLAVIAAAAHLGWEYTHGGIRSHHLLNRADLPTISNAWGLLVLPVLGWLAGSIVARRASAAPSAARKALAGFLGALAAGCALSVAFIAGSESAAGAVFLGVLLSGLVLPTYRAEYLFGFVLGMTFVFGSILPTLFGLLAVGISAAAHLLLWPAGMWVLRRARG